MASSPSSGDVAAAAGLTRDRGSRLKAPVVGRDDVCRRTRDVDHALVHPRRTRDVDAVERPRAAMPASAVTPALVVEHRRAVRHEVQVERRRPSSASRPAARTRARCCSRRAIDDDRVARHPYAGRDVLQRHAAARRAASVRERDAADDPRLANRAAHAPRGRSPSTSASASVNCGMSRAQAVGVDVHGERALGKPRRRRAQREVHRTVPLARQHLPPIGRTTRPWPAGLVLVAEGRAQVGSSASS